MFNRLQNSLQIPFREYVLVCVFSVYFVTLCFFPKKFLPWKPVTGNYQRHLYWISKFYLLLKNMEWNMWPTNSWKSLLNNHLDIVLMFYWCACLTHWWFQLTILNFTSSRNAHFRYIVYVLIFILPHAITIWAIWKCNTVLSNKYINTLKCISDVFYLRWKKIYDILNPSRSADWKPIQIDTQTPNFLVDCFVRCNLVPLYSLKITCPINFSLNIEV